MGGGTGPYPGCFGENGAFGVGGAGKDGTGGGGGAGLYGGGGGGCSYTSAWGGGGGGSSRVPTGGTRGTPPLPTPARIDIVYTPAAGGGGGAKDTKSPALSQFGLSRTAFSAAKRGPSLTAAVGTRVSYRLSEPATTRFTVERAAKGRRKGKRCLRKGKGKRCTRYVKLKGSFTHTGAIGRNSFKFTGRLRKRALRRGRYRLVAVATDGAKNRSKPVRRKFRIK
jgi:hypothetical protein